MQSKCLLPQYINNQQYALEILLCNSFIINIEVHLVGYLYIMDLINARKMGHIKNSLLLLFF